MTDVHLSRERTGTYRLLALVGIALLVVVLYYGVFNAPFIFDDKSSIIENSTIRSIPLTIKSYSINRYIGLISFSLNYALGGLRTYGYHLVNIAIHVMNAVLVYLIASLLLRFPDQTLNGRAKDFVAYGTAFAFAAHPLQTQAVSYLSQRYTSLSVLFYFFSLYLFLRARSGELDSGETGGRFKLPPSLYLGGSLIAALAAMKTKEIAATLPLMMIAVELCFFGTRGRKRKIAAFLVVMMALPIVLYAVPLLSSRGASSNGIAASVDMITRETAQIPRQEYLMTQVRVITTYLRLLLLPFNQTLDYDYPAYQSLFSPDLFGPAFLLLLLTASAFYFYRRNRMLTFGIIWFFIGLSVESSIIPIRDVINEHRLYLPSAGFFLAATAAVAGTTTPGKAKIALAAACIFLFSAATINRNSVWSDPALLWKDVVAKAPLNERAYVNLGVVLKERKEYDSAAARFRSALKLKPDYVPALYNLGDIAYIQKNYSEALAYLTTSREMNTDYQFGLEIINKLGRTYGALGRLDEAVDIFEKGLVRYPHSSVLLNNLGVQYIKQGKPELAIDLYEHALKERPEYSMYVNLSVAYQRTGEEEKGRQAYQKAMTLKQISTE